MTKRFSAALAAFLFEYETPRQALVKNKRVGIVCRLIQLGVLAYIIGWVFIYEKGYQTSDPLIGSILTKMKGIGVTEVNGTERVWDVADYVFPQQGDASFVVMTNYIMTQGQQQGKCPEFQVPCTSDNNCTKGTFARAMTGKCVQETGTCEVYGWCPVEKDTAAPDPPLLMVAENYTLFIKNSIVFPSFDVYRSNLIEIVDSTYLNTCLYDKDKAPYCPIFRLGDIVTLSGFDFYSIALQGGTIGITINWDCNLDLPVRLCRPEYSFHGLYGTTQQSTAASLGYNFRYGIYYIENGTEKRTLIKVFGIRIDIVVQGQAGKFDIIPTLTAIGSGVGIFGVATVVCDLLLLYIVPQRDIYKNVKYKYTETQEEEPVLHENVAVVSNTNYSKGPEQQ